MDKKVRKRKTASDLPTCQYGPSCYRKNPDHLKKFHHKAPLSNNEKLSKETEVESMLSSKLETSGSDVDIGPKMETSDVDISPKVETTDVDLSSKVETNVSSVGSNNNVPSVTNNVGKYAETVKNILCGMPKDFHDFWKFCSTINKSEPQSAFSQLGLHLVGIYDLLVRKLSESTKVVTHCHWRYYYDPPEFQTVIKSDNQDLYHIGYFRDDPAEFPKILASNKAAKGPQLSLMGDNIFAAMNSELANRLKKLKSKKMQEKFVEIQKNLVKLAKEKKYSLEIPSSSTKARSKKVNSKTFHGLGIVVPVKKDVGYRPLPDSDAKIKTILKRIVSAETEESRLDEEEGLDDIMSNVHIGNDECDFGMGLELGIDLFCFGDPYFHKQTLNLLSLAYDLLQRPKYGEIIEAHLADRKKSGELDCLIICDE